MRSSYFTNTANLCELYPFPYPPKFQIRAINKFDLHGGWSEPKLIFNSSSYDIGSRKRGSESSNEVWIYVVASMLCVVGAALLAVLVLCIYRHYCFHRRIKYVSHTTLLLFHTSGILC